MFYCIPYFCVLSFLETLNGEIAVIQKNKTRDGLYVSSADTVIHNVTLKSTDADLVKPARTLTYWFIDCTYYGFRNDFIFPFNYTKPDETHFIEALVVADFTPLPPPTTTTTTTTARPSTTTIPTKPTTTTTTVKPNTTTTIPTTIKPITTTPKATTLAPTFSTQSITNVAKSIVKRDLNQNTTTTSNIKVNVNGTLVKYNGSFPYVCNSTAVATDPEKTYGYFFRKIEVKGKLSIYVLYCNMFYDVKLIFIMNKKIAFSMFMINEQFSLILL